MSRYGRITVECDSRDCSAEVSYSHNAIEAELSDMLSDEGWTRTADGKDQCPDCCAPENPRQKGDDDGIEYADPRDHRKGID